MLTCERFNILWSNTELTGFIWNMREFFLFGWLFLHSGRSEGGWVRGVVLSCSVSCPIMWQTDVAIIAKVSKTCALHMQKANTLWLRHTLTYLPSPLSRPYSMHALLVQLVQIFLWSMAAHTILSLSRYGWKWEFHRTENETILHHLSIQLIGHKSKGWKARIDCHFNLSILLHDISIDINKQAFHHLFWGMTPFSLSQRWKRMTPPGNSDYAIVIPASPIGG